MSIVNPWSIKASSGGGGEAYAPCPAGNYPATVVGIFDVGTQANNYQGEEKNAVQIVILYELDELDGQGKPFVLWQRFTYSLNTKSNFAKWVQAISGKALTDGEVVNVLGFATLPVMVQVGHKEVSKDGKTRAYHYVVSVSQLPKKMKPAEPTLETVVWSARTAEEFPDRDWYPRIYGETIRQIAENSRETRQRQRLNDLENGDDIAF